MSEIITVGLDLAKNVFQLHGADALGRAVPDPALHGNGRACPDCDPAAVPSPWCPKCGGRGRVAIPTAEIVERQVKEARRVYWRSSEHLLGLESFADTSDDSSY